MSLRGDQVREGAIHRWRGKYGMTVAEIRDAQELARKAKMRMDTACRYIVRLANKRAAK